MATTTTVKPLGFTNATDYFVSVVELSTITPGEALDVAHNGPGGAEVYKMDYEVVVRGLSPVVEVAHIRASDSLTSDTARVQVATESGGDLTNAVVRLYFHFAAQASGGISA
jgi:hypothetical protein